MDELLVEVRLNGLCCKKIILFGDAPGVRQMMSKVPLDSVVAISGASNRPKYLPELSEIAKKNNKLLLVQPKWMSAAYQSYRQYFSDLNPDLILVNSYSMIVRDDVLSTCRLGALNIHTALLPRNRGCNPTQWAIINQEYETGVTLHEIDTGLDTGPIIDQRRVPIFFEDTWLDVQLRLEKEIDTLLDCNMAKILSGSWSAYAQSDIGATIGRRRHPEDGLFKWTDTVIDIHNKIRALVPPLPSAHYYNRENKKIEINDYRTPWQITIDKYSSDNGLDYIKSKLISLRPLKKDEISLIISHYSDTERDESTQVRRCIDQINRYPKLDFETFKRSDIIIFILEDVICKNFIGTGNLININWRNKSVEMDIKILNKNINITRYFADATRLLCEFCFQDLNLQNIYIDTSRASERLLHGDNFFKKMNIGFEIQGNLLVLKRKKNGN